MISYEVQEELFSNLMPHSKSHDWYNPESSDGRSSGRKFRIPDFTSDDIEDEIATYIGWLVTRSGDDYFVRMLMKWFTTEDLLFYKMAYDEDGTWMLSYDNPHKSVRVKVKPGKFYRKFQSDRHRVNDIVVDGNYIVELARQFSEDWADATEHSQNQHRAYDVTVHKRSYDIMNEYRQYHGTSLQSCMSHPASDLSTGDVHPALCYGSESHVHLATVYHIESGNRIGRTLLYNGKWVRIYPPNDTEKKRLVAAVLRSRSIASGQTSLEGAKLNFYAHGDDPRLIVCPYLDGPYSKVRPVYHRGNPDPLHILVTDEGRVIDTQDGDFHRIACFDPDDMSLHEVEYDYSCDSCGTRFNDGSGQVLTSDHTFCCGECANESGYEMAFINSSDYQEWTNEGTHEWEGDYYTEDALQYRDLCVLDSGYVYKREECTMTERGYYVNDDLIFINTIEEFNKIARDNPRILDMVWIHPDDNEGFFLFRSSVRGTTETAGVEYLKEYYKASEPEPVWEVPPPDEQPF